MYIYFHPSKIVFITSHLSDETNIWFCEYLSKMWNKLLVRNFMRVIIRWRVNSIHMLLARSDFWCVVSDWLCDQNLFPSSPLPFLSRELNTEEPLSSLTRVSRSPNSSELLTSSRDYQVEFFYLMTQKRSNFFIYLLKRVLE